MTSFDLSSVIPFAEHAPSVLNTQPWTFAVVGETVEVRADRSRGLPVVDPTGRQLMISCGAALEFADIAVRGLGWAATSTVLPDPAQPDLVGVVLRGSARVPEVDENDLLTAITQRYTDRGDYEPQTIAPQLVDVLHAELGALGTWLRILDHPGDRLAVIQALNDAETFEASEPAYRHETEQWLRTSPSLDGIPTAALMIDPGATQVIDVPTRDFRGRNEHPRPSGAGPALAVERDTLLMIGTESDTPTAWVNAGRALDYSSCDLLRTGCRHSRSASSSTSRQHAPRSAVSSA